MDGPWGYKPSDIIRNIKQESDDETTPGIGSPAKNTRAMRKLQIKEEDTQDPVSKRITRFDSKRSSSSTSTILEESNFTNRRVTRESTRASTRASAVEQHFRALQSKKMSKRTSRSRKRSALQLDPDYEVPHGQSRFGKRILKTEQRSLSREHGKSKMNIFDVDVYARPFTRSQSLAINTDQVGDGFGYNLRKFPWRVRRLEALAAAKRLRTNEEFIPSSRRSTERKPNIKREVVRGINNRAIMPDQSSQRLTGKPIKREQEPLTGLMSTRSSGRTTLKRAINQSEFANEPSTSSGFKKLRMNKSQRSENIPINPYFTRSSATHGSDSTSRTCFAKKPQEEDVNMRVKSEERYSHHSQQELEPLTVLPGSDCIERRAAKLSARKRASLARPVRKYAESLKIPASQHSQSVGKSSWQGYLPTPDVSSAPPEQVSVILVSMEVIEVSCEELYALNQEIMKSNAFLPGANATSLISSLKTEAVGRNEELFDPLSTKKITLEDKNLQTSKAKKLPSRRKQTKGDENLGVTGVPSPMDAQRVQRCLRDKFAEWNLFDCSTTVIAHQTKCESCDQPDGLDKTILDELAERGRRKRLGNGSSRSPIEDQLGVPDCSK